MDRDVDVEWSGVGDGQENDEQLTAVIGQYVLCHTQTLQLIAYQSLVINQ